MNSIRIMNIVIITFCLFLLIRKISIFCPFSVLRMNCLLIRPRWMWEERDVIGDIPLNALMIPGTHNSGSYIPKGSNVSFMIIANLDTVLLFNFL